jgi:hypothetical protein
MRETLAALLATTTLAVAVLPTSAQARSGWGWRWDGFDVGLATGAILGGALTGHPYYPYDGYWYGYGYPSHYYGYYPGYYPAYGYYRPRYYGYYRY